MSQFSSTVLVALWLCLSLRIANVTSEDNSQQCAPYRTAPAATTLSCTPTLCTATCMAKYKFPKGETTLNVECVNQIWTIKEENYKNLKELPGCQPICSPPCANKGQCIAPNRCQCSKDFQGPTCKEKACRNPPAMTRNSKRTCKPSQCTVMCIPGFKFTTLATTMNVQCRNGNWLSTTRNLPLTSHCEPFCNPKCLNGGQCIGYNKCKCTDKFRGPQCQHSADKCSPKKTGFNGSFECLGSENEMSCSLSCPDGVEFEFLAAPIYKCKYSEGKFTPAPMPKCAFKEGVQVGQINQVEAVPAKITSVGSLCNPSCQNGGACVFRNTCQCPQNFAGPQCQYSTDRCSPKSTGFNGGFSCSGTATGMSCTLSCPAGIDFESPPASSYTCSYESGKFTPSKLPKCVYGDDVEVIHRNVVEAAPQRLSSVGPLCNPSCQNGGACVFRNTCQCPQNFAGPQCQYSTARCSPKSTGFNGGFSCSGTATGMSCTLSCPAGIDFESPPASSYTCSYESGKFTPSKLPKCVYGDDVEVIHRNVVEAAPQRLSSVGPLCNPSCQNGGACVFRNTCQCPQNFAGPQCQYSTARCSPKSTGFNGGFSCSGTATGMSCTLSCPAGIEFESPPASSYTCSYESGKFTPSKLPKCVYGDDVEVIHRNVVEAAPERLSSVGPLCNPSCQNGGACVFRNTCQCPQNFAGPQCQHSTARCSPKSTGFNGGFSCSGTATGMSCTLSCPAGIEFESSPASSYTCSYESGKFTPSKLPKCVYGDDVEVIQRNLVEAAPQRLSSVGVLCSQPCQNGGVCISRNTCQCTQGFEGPQCQHSFERCSPKKLDFDGAYKCSISSTGVSCSISCPFIKHFEYPPAAAYTCSFDTGIFTPAKAPKCIFESPSQEAQRNFFSRLGDVREPKCSPECKNEGICIFANTCHCPSGFGGPQCQLPLDRCSLKKTGFNGGYRCSGSLTEMSCTLSCPEGVDFEFQPASAYVCSFENGRFNPSVIPNCVYGEGYEIISTTSN